MELSVLLYIILPTFGYQKTHQEVFIFKFFLKPMSNFFFKEDKKSIKPGTQVLRFELSRFSKSPFIHLAIHYLITSSLLLIIPYSATVAEIHK